MSDTLQVDPADASTQTAAPDAAAQTAPTDASAQTDSSDPAVPTPPPTSVQKLREIVEGISAINDLAGAKGILLSLGVAAVFNDKFSTLSELASALSEALSGELSPVSWFLQPLKSLIEVLNAMETEERGAGMRSWCYTVTYDAMGMGVPPEPKFSGSLKGSDQDALDQKWWDDSRAQAQKHLADGKDGVALRNRVLLLIAKCNGDPAAAVNVLWVAACQKSGDDGNAGLLAAYPNLSWPQPTGA